MKPNLLIGLGNSMAGDDGIGLRVARALAGNPPETTEVAAGGTDLLRLVDRMAGRERVIVVDAMLSAEPPGRVGVFEDDFDGVSVQPGHAHHLSAVQAVRLLRTVVPALSGVRFTLITITVSGAAAGEQLSPELAASLPDIVRRVREAVTAPHRELAHS
jgi:hydrogenase maturation protease